MRHVKQKERRGSSLLLSGLIFSVISVIFLLVFFVSQTIDIRMQSQIENLQVSTLAAKNTLEAAHAFIGKDRDWGKNGESITWRDGLARPTGVPVGDGSFGIIRFRLADSESERPPTINIGAPPPSEAQDPTSPLPRGLPTIVQEWKAEWDSINNLGGNNSVIGYDGIIVPPNSILVVAVGEHRNKRQIAYQIYNGSPQPYSLGAEGSLKVTGETLVAGLDSLEQAAELPPNPAQQQDSDPTDWQEAGLVSNDGGADAVVLDGDIHVVGDVEAVGQIQQGSQVTIDGEPKPNSRPQDFPEVDFDSWDPKGDPNNPDDDRATLVERTESVVPDAINNPLYGFQRFSGDTHFPQGLKLDGSAIYVDGNVTFDGPVEGSGLIVARGDVIMNGGSNMKADVMAAVLAEGDLTVSGAAGQPSTFQGLLYSTGDLTLSNSRTIGTAISASDATGQPGTLTVEDSTVIATPDTSDFRIVLKKYGLHAGPQGMGGASVINTGGNGWEFLEPNPADLLIDGEFKWDPTLLKIRIEQPDGSWVVVDKPDEAIAAGLAKTEESSLESAYQDIEADWKDNRISELQSQYEQELVDILDFNFNEFLKVSSQLKSRQIFYVE